MHFPRRRRQSAKLANGIAAASCLAAWLLVITFQCSSNLVVAQTPSSPLAVDVDSIPEGLPLNLSEENNEKEEGEEEKGNKDTDWSSQAAFAVTTTDDDAPNMAVEDGLINKDWVLSAVDATVSVNLFWPEVEAEGKNQSQNESLSSSSSSPTSLHSNSPPNTNASVLAVTFQRFGYVNLRKKDTAVRSVTHVCLDIYIGESKQTVLTAVGYAFRDGRALSLSAHTIIESNRNYSAGAWNSMSIPLPDALDAYWYELRIEEKSVQGSVIYIQNAGFCDARNATRNTGTSQYKQCLWSVENPNLKQELLLEQQSSATSTAAAVSSSTSIEMPFIEAVYLSGFGLSPFWVDKSFVGFYDFSYILPSGETAVKALVGPNGALSLSSEASFQHWTALHFQILASSSEIDVCVEVSRNKESREQPQCLESLWNQSSISGAWVDVSAPLSDFGDVLNQARPPWNRFSLADGSTAGVFYLVTNILFNAKADSSTSELWVLDIIDSPPELSGFLDREEVPATPYHKSSHTLGWSIGIVVGVVAALIIIPILLCIVYPKQPGRRLTSIPLFCVAAHETVKEVLEDIVSPRFRFRVPATVKMKAADKKGWVENENSLGSQEDGWAYGDSNNTNTTNIEGILPVYGESSRAERRLSSEDSSISPPMLHAPTQLGNHITADNNITTTTTTTTTPLSTGRQIMYPIRRGGSCTLIETASSPLDTAGRAGAMSDPRPLYRRTSILESDSEEYSSYMGESSPLPIPIISARTTRKVSNLQHIDEALKFSCKMLMESSSDLKKLFAYNRPRGRHIRRVASETIDISIASDYHTLIEKQIASLQNAQRIIADEWKVMKDIGSEREEGELTSKQQQIMSRIPSRTDVESMNVDMARDVQITGLIGSGGNGNVYHGFYKGHRVAIKMLHNNSAFTHDQLNSLKTEVELLQNLRHPNIVNFLGSCLNPPQVCVILEYAEGGSLHNMLHTNQKQPEYGTLLQLAEDVASAMDYCHGLDPPIIHRDLKPQNILLRRDGRAQVADFGIARMRQGTFVETKHLNAGTVAYMSPEIMQGRKVDEKCDVYSFGVIMWECLTGEKPWSDKLLPMQVVVAVGVEGDRLPVPLECPISLKRLIKDCWRHDPRLRPTFREIKLRLAYIRNKHGTHHR
jgi:predicted Ser/Thr protein kinase